MLEFRPDSRYQRYWRYFRSGRFSDASQIAEVLGQEGREADHAFYQALGQIAQSLQHLNQGDLEPADRMAHSAGIGLRRYGSSYQGVQLEALLLGLTACLEDARRCLDEQGCIEDLRLRIPRVDLALGLDPESSSD